MGNPGRLIVVLGLWLSLSSIAYAHHPVSEAGASRVEPSTHFETQFETASFDFGGREVGSWQVLSLRAEYSLVPRLSVSANVPFALLNFSDGRAAMGLSDIELAMNGLVYASPHGGAIISSGLGVALPTGVAADGLSAGHYEGSAFVMLSSQVSIKLNLYANGTYKHALGDGVVATDSLFPHNNREFDFSQGAQWFWTPKTWTELVTREVISWEDSWGDLWEAGFRVGFRVADSFRLSSGVWLPLSGESRTLWRANLNLAWLID